MKYPCIKTKLWLFKSYFKGRVTEEKRRQMEGNGREGRGKRKRSRETPIFHLHLLTYSQMLLQWRLSQAKAKSQKLCPGLPRVWQESKYLYHHLLPALEDLALKWTVIRNVGIGVPVALQSPPLQLGCKIMICVLEVHFVHGNHHELGSLRPNWSRTSRTLL